MAPTISITLKKYLLLLCLISNFPNNIWIESQNSHLNFIFVYAGPIAAPANNPIGMQLSSLDNFAQQPQSIYQQLYTFPNATHDAMLELRQALLTKSTKFDEFFRSLLASSKTEFHRMFLRTYGILYEQNAEIFTGMYENLERYYATGGVKLNQAMQSFFNRLCLKMFQVLNMQYDFSPAYLNCTSQQLDMLRPFGPVRDKLITEIEQSFIATRTFVQALNNGIDVIKNLIALGPTNQCGSIVQKVHTSLSQQQQQVQKPLCISSCEQVMNKCYSRLNVEFDREWNAYVDALSLLANRMRTSSNIEIVVKPIDIRVSEAIMNFQDNGAQITNQVFQACGSPKSSIGSSLARQKRSFAEAEPRAARKGCDELWVIFSRPPNPSMDLVQLYADLLEFQKKCSSYARPASLARLSERECAKLLMPPIQSKRLPNSHGETTMSHSEELIFTFSKKVHEINCQNQNLEKTVSQYQPNRTQQQIHTVPVMVKAATSSQSLPQPPTPASYPSNTQQRGSNNRRIGINNETTPIPFVGVHRPSTIAPLIGNVKNSLGHPGTGSNNNKHRATELQTPMGTISDAQNIEIIGELVTEICDQINRTMGFWSRLPTSVCTNKNIIGIYGAKQLQLPTNCIGFPSNLLADGNEQISRHFKASLAQNNGPTVADSRYNNVISQQIYTLRTVVLKVNKAIEGHDVDWNEPTIMTTTTTTTPIPDFSNTDTYESPPSGSSSDVDTPENVTNGDPESQDDSEVSVSGQSLNDEQPIAECPPGFEPVPSSLQGQNEDDVNIEPGSGNGANGGSDDEADDTGDVDDDSDDGGASDDVESEVDGESGSSIQDTPVRQQISCRPIATDQSTQASDAITPDGDSSTEKPIQQDKEIHKDDFLDGHKSTEPPNEIDHPVGQTADQVTYSPERIPPKGSEVGIILVPDSSSSSATTIASLNHVILISSILITFVIRTIMIPPRS